MNNLIKKMLFFLIVFTIIAVLTTFILIKNNTSIPNSDNGYDIETKEKGIDLYGTYNENDLLIEDLIETFSGEEIKIPQINGLKNKQIEEKINQKIYNRCNKCIQDTAKNIVEFYEIYSFYDVMSNFSNVISINFYLNINGNITHIYLNYNLITGEILKFEDLFIKNADVIGIVRKAFLERISNDNYWDNVIEGDYIASFDENELYKIVKGFMENEEKEFMFSPSTLYIYFKNYGAMVKLIDIADSVSIYTKYLTDKSIYETNDIGRKNIFTLVETNYDIFKSIEYGYLEENMWYDVTFGGLYLPPDSTISDDRLEKCEILEDKILKETYLKVEQYRDIAKNNSDKFYMIFTRPIVQIYIDDIYDENNGWIYTYSDMATTRIYTRLYEMPLEVYENTYKDKLIDAYRYEYFVMSGGAQIISESGDGAIYKEDIDERIYDYMNDVRITKLSDIFYEDSNYESVIKDHVRNLLLYNYNTDKDVEELVNNIKYELVGNRIVVTIPELEDFETNIIYDEFPKEMIKLFDKEG